MTLSICEPVRAQVAFIQDELSKGLCNPGVMGVCCAMIVELQYLASWISSDKPNALPHNRVLLTS